MYRRCIMENSKKSSLDEDSPEVNRRLIVLLLTRRNLSNICYQMVFLLHIHNTLNALSNYSLKQAFNYKQTALSAL